MPGYGILPADQGTGLLPWSWAVERLLGSHDFWVATVWPDGRPHTMPVWGVWDPVGVGPRQGVGISAAVLWFSSSLRSRKIRNIQAGSDVSVSTEDPKNPVVLEGSAEIVTEGPAIQHFLQLMNAKYNTDYGLDFLDPAKNASVRVRPRWAFGVAEGDFGGSPTRWEFS
jgi:pyridoxamine 5'-phosphate oxidase-like protein